MNQIIIPTVTSFVTYLTTYLLSRQDSIAPHWDTLLFAIVMGVFSIAVGTAIGITLHYVLQKYNAEKKTHWQ